MVGEVGSVGAIGPDAREGRVFLVQRPASAGLGEPAGPAVHRGAAGLIVNNVVLSVEVALVGGDHRVDVSALPLEQPDLRLQVLDLLGQELDEVLQVLPLLLQLILLLHVLVFLTHAQRTKSCLPVESSFFFSSFSRSPSSVISLITLVFWRLA